jgi:hypothetical protein
MAKHNSPLPGAGSSLLIGFLTLGIAVFFGLFGAVLAGATMLWAISNSGSSSDSGFGIVIAGIFAAGLGFVVGLCAGLSMAKRILSRSTARWMAIPMTAVSVVAVGLVLGWNAMIEAQSRAALNDVRENHAADQARLNGELADFVRRAKADAPRLFGDLIYPGAEILASGYYDALYPRLELKAKERPSVVQDYYRSRLTDARQEGKILRGSAIRVGDNRPLEVTVESAGTGGTSITIVTTGVPAPVAPTKSPSEILASDPSWVPVTEVPEVTTAYAGMLYPGSRTNYPSVDHTRAPGMAVLMTADSLEPVIAFYRPLVTVRQDEPTRFVGSVELPDGKTRFVQVDRAEPFTKISFSGG